MQKVPQRLPTQLRELCLDHRIGRTKCTCAIVSSSCLPETSCNEVGARRRKPARPTRALSGCLKQVLRRSGDLALRPSSLGEVFLGMRARFGGITGQCMEGKFRFLNDTEVSKPIG